MRRVAHTLYTRVLVWSTSQACVAHRGRAAVGFSLSVLCLLVLTACGATSQQRVLYQEGGIQVGIITDLSTHEHAMPPVRNRHPVDLTPNEIRSLVATLEVSGWSGTLVGLFSAPQPKPLFTEAERVLLAEPLAAALREVTPRERVFFSLQNPTAPYDTDRTAGSLFFRDDYLHVVLTDHYEFLQADPGGGEKRDPRDMKGMKLWVVGSARAASVPDEKEPHWTAFEKVHISLTPVEILAGERVHQSVTSSSKPPVVLPAAGLPALKSDTAATGSTESVNDLRLQVRELTDANLDLRAQLKEQSDTIEKLKADFEKLRSEKQPGSLKSSPGQKPARKQATP